MTELTLPEAEADCLREVYRRAQVILEYGSGGSTLVGANLPGKLVLSVESDRDWAVGLQAKIDRKKRPSSAILWYADIGPVGPWGRPVGPETWQRFYAYPLSIWDQPFFRHPDAVLIDGRFRVACFTAVCLRITRPVTVLFDDYVDRPRYHQVEALAKPERIVGRMAVFHLSPGLLTREQATAVLRMSVNVSYAQRGNTDYSDPEGQR